MLLAATSARAFDFGAVTSSGHQMYYEVFESTTNIVVVNPGWSESNAPTGLLVLDATVTHEGTTYHLTDIDANAFMNCSELTGIVIPEGVTTIGRMAFAFCTALDSISLPSTLTQIGTMAFTATAFMDNPENLTPDGMLFAGAYLIGTLRNVQDSLVVPEGTLGLGNMALYNCHLLDKVVLPSTLRFIGDLSFQDCIELDTLVIHTTVPPSLGYDAFLNAGDFVTAVPCSTAAVYGSVEEWQGQTFVEQCNGQEAIVVADAEGAVTVTVVADGIVISHNGELRCTVSDITGRQLASTCSNEELISLPAPGVYIVSAPGIKAMKVTYIR